MGEKDRSEEVRLTPLDEQRAEQLFDRILVALLISLLLPTELSLVLGPLRLAPYRVVILATFFPCVSAFLSNRTGPRVAADYLVPFAAAWVAVSLGKSGGVMKAIESGGVLFAEAWGAYLIGRCAIRGPSDLRRLGKRFTWMILAVLATSLPEMITGVHIVHDVMQMLTGRRQPTTVEGRLGLHRAYGPFDHPILLGTFCGSVMGIAWCAKRGGFMGRVGRAGTIALGTITSLSSACMLALVVQGGLIFYRWLLRSVKVRWHILVVACLTFYTAVSLASSRPGYQALVWYMTLDRHTASFRIQIWEHGMNNVEMNPIFGVGSGEWVRPSWMGASIDSYWLFTWVTYGTPALAGTALAVLLTIYAVIKRPQDDEDAADVRRSWLVTMLALSFVAFTVHYWNHLFVMFNLLLASGTWLAEDRAEEEPT